MMPYEFNAIDKDGMKRWIQQNIGCDYLGISIYKIVDSMESKIARVSTHAK